MRRRLSVEIALTVALAAAYFAAAKLGLQFAFLAEQVTTVWPPTGLALAALRLFGYRVWPGIAAGAFFANVTTHEPVLTAVGIAAGNTLEAVVSVWLLDRVVGFRNSLERFKDVIGLVVCAACVGPVIAATTGTMSLCLGGVQSWNAFGMIWSVWWLGDSLGALVVAPILLVWSSNWRPSLPWGSTLEWVLSLLVLITVSLHVFGSLRSESHTQYAYALFPIIIWTALRFGQHGTTSAILIISCIAIVGTVNGLGPFTRPSVDESLHLLQSFTALMSVTGMLLAAAMIERLNAEQVIKESERRKDTFLAMLAHELRNPLAPITSAVETLRVKRTPDPDVNELTDIIGRQVQQMARLVDDLLDLSRISRDTLKLRPELVDLREVVQSAIETSRPHIDARRHHLEVKLPPSRIVMNIDRARMVQVISNLLNNAAKFTPANGQICLIVKPLSDGVEMSVSDNGIGLSPAESAHIFEKFTQANAERSEHGGGLGLGLWLVKRVVEMHGGKVGFHSSGVDKGSVFTVWLPNACAGQGAAPSDDLKRDATTANSQRRRILVVDDNRDAAHTLELLLSAYGNDVRKAYDGQQAVELAESYRPDLVFMDIGMPRLNGYDAARQIRNSDWGREMVLVALTGWGKDEDRQLSEVAGFTRHLTKPVEFDKLQSLLETLTARMS